MCWKNFLELRYYYLLNYKIVSLKYFSENKPVQIVGNEFPNGLYYQLEVTLSHIHGNSFTRLAQYAGTYTLTSEKKNDRYVWVKKSGSGGHAIWRKAGGWRIGSISEKERNTDNTAFKSDGRGKNPIDDGQWQYRVRNRKYRNDNGIIKHLDHATDKNERDLLFDGRRSLQLHVANFRKAFEGLVDGTDKVA